MKLFGCVQSILMLGFSCVFCSSLEESLYHLREQEHGQAFSTFLEALEEITPGPPKSMTDEEKQLYDEALQIYLRNTGRAARPAAEEIYERYAEVVRDHPDYTQLGYLVALAAANGERYEEFFQRFYASYRVCPNHFLAHKTKALLHLKLKERARDPDQADMERKQVARFAELALELSPADVSLHQMRIQFAAPKERKERVRASLINMLQDTMIIPRSDLLFFVKEAMDTDETDLARQLLDKAREWYPKSRAVDAAEEYMRLQEK